MKLAEIRAELAERLTATLGKTTDSETELQAPRRGLSKGRTLAQTSPDLPELWRALTPALSRSLQTSPEPTCQKLTFELRLTFTWKAAFFSSASGPSRLCRPSWRS